MKAEQFKNAYLKWVLGVVVYAAFVLILASFYFPGLSFVLKVGGVAPRDIVSPREDQIVDQEATEVARKSAEDREPVVYDMDPKVQESALKRIDALFNLLNEIIRDKSLLTEADKAEAIRVELGKSNLGFDLKQEQIVQLAGANTAQLEDLRTAVADITRAFLAEGVNEERVRTISTDIEARIQQRAYNQWTRGLVREITKNTISVNQFKNEEKTNRNREIARNRISPILRSVSEGEIIVRAGDTITPEAMNAIEVLGIARNVWDLKTWVAIIMLPFLILLVLYMIIATTNPALFSDTPKIVLLASLLVALITASRLLVPISPFLTILPLTTVIMTLFLGSGVSIPILFVIAPLCAMFKSVGSQPVSSTITLAAGYTLIAYMTAVHLPKVKRFTHFVTVFIYSIIGTAFVAALFAMFSGQERLAILTTIAIAVGSSSVQIALALAITPFLEFLTGHTTVFRLLELSDLNHPLLRRLMVEAPGTYQHSVMVGNMASIACEEIGANSLLARVGGYYHDIGKMLYPQYFIENQVGANPHDNLDPETSKEVVTKHVTEGMGLAKQYRLPQEVMGFIDSHHGTSMVGFFLLKAKEKDPNAKEQDFRYIGHPPNTTEEAVLMLADSVESASRAYNLQQNTCDIEDVVENIFNEKLKDEQLQNSPISLAQLNEVKKSFIGQLTSYYHKRIPYPTERGTKHGQ